MGMKLAYPTLMLIYFYYENILTVSKETEIKTKEIKNETMLRFSTVERKKN